MTLLVKGGRVVNPAMQQDEICDILIENGKIKEVGANLSADGAEIFDASGLVVAPGFIDMHVHLRQPGQSGDEGSCCRRHHPRCDHAEYQAGHRFGNHRRRHEV